VFLNTINSNVNIIKINNFNKTEYKSILNAKYAALLMFHGSPNELGDINIFIENILKNKMPVSQKSSIIDNIIKRYKETGGSPLSYNISDVANTMCNEYNIPTYIGARYNNPYICNTINKIIKDGYDSIIIIYMSPYYNHTFVFNEYIKLIQNYILTINIPLKCYVIHSWYNYKLFHQIWFNNIKKTQLYLSQLYAKKYIKFLFCAHGLPQNMVSYKDLYLSQINNSVRYLTKELKCSNEEWGFSFQNSSNYKWVQPSILNNKILKEKIKSLIVVPIGFISNNFDILYDIDIELRKKLLEKKILLYKTKMPTSNINFIKLITILYRKTIAYITLKYL